MYFNMQVGAHENAKQANFIFFRLSPTFDMLCLNVFPLDKCKKKNICVAVCFGFPYNLTALLLCS